MLNRTVLITGHLLVAAWTIVASIDVLADEPPVEQRAAIECVPRGGLPNVTSRLKAGQDVRVAYLGGSITDAAGWRVKSLDWLKRENPTAKISEIHAAIGGTGAELGVYRLNHDVLAFEPNLLFVEFAVNDGGTDPVQLTRCIEGIVRQTWRADPKTDICFVYTTCVPFYADLKTGKASRAASTMEAVADFYGIPSIQLALEVVQLEAAGKLIFSGPKPTEPRKPDDPIIFSEDSVHPLDDGHELYFQAIRRSWPKLIPTSAAVPHRLGEPLRADNWEQAKMAPVTSGMLRGGWKQQDLTTDSPARYFSARVPSMWKTIEPGSTLEFDFEGRAASVYDLLGPDCGIVEVQVDHQPAFRMPRMDGFSIYPRLATLPILNEPTSAKHHVKLTLLAEGLEKAKILFPENRSDLEKNPQKYAENGWYVGGILVLGDVAN